MRDRVIHYCTASMAALALMAAPAAFAQGNGKGNGSGNSAAVDNVKPEKSKPGKGGGNGKSNGSNAKNSDRANANRGEDKRAQQGNSRSDRASEKRGNANPAKLNRGNGKPGIDNRATSNDRGNRVNGGKIDRRDRIDGDFALPLLRERFGTRSRLIDGCPPGLAKKRNGCLPPGQAKKQYRGYEPGFFGLRGTDAGRYLYDSGYLLRYRDDGLAGFIPLLAGALNIGNVWPSYYEPQPLPRYYTDYYGLDDPRGYRYADDVIYRVDPETAAITSVAALLTGDDIAIGQPMPRGYDVYNVPYSYRERYYDRPDARYRYADGYVYEIDPETALVVAAIDLLT